jgi:hypothetical protein
MDNTGSPSGYKYSEMNGPTLVVFTSSSPDIVPKKAIVITCHHSLSELSGVLAYAS